MAETGTAVLTNHFQCNQRRWRPFPIDFHQADVAMDKRSGDAVLISGFCINLIDMRHAAGGQFKKRIAGCAALGKLGEMNIPGEQNNAFGTRAADQIKQFFPFPGEITPFVHSFFIGYDLDARGDQTHDGRFFQLLPQPAPLLVAQQGLFCIDL